MLGGIRVPCSPRQLDQGSVLVVGSKFMKNLLYNQKLSRKFFFRCYLKLTKKIGTFLYNPIDKYCQVVYKLKKRKDTMLVKDKNGNLTYWWNLPIDELEEMADEDGKIKTEKMNMSKKEMKANIMRNIKKDQEEN